MTLTTWKKEFYKKPAKAEMTRIEAIQHSLLKWEGLRKANLKKHGVIQDADKLRYKNSHFYIDDRSCALCVKYLDVSSDCKDCPLSQALGFRCDSFWQDPSPYAAFTSNKNPVPMIKGLKKALKRETENTTA